MAVELAKLGLRSSSSRPSSAFTATASTLRRDNHRLFRFPKLRDDGYRAGKLSIFRSAALVDDREYISFTESENELIEAILGIQGRGRSASPQQLQAVEKAVQALEAQKGVPDPTSSSVIEGCWQLIFTTRPGTASPIQRTFVGVDFFSVFQDVYLRTNDPRVSNIVRFSEAIGELKVEAAASIKDGKRILFRFDKAAFSFRFLPFKVPYPVPFRLLGDEAKGWLDTTYLSYSGNIRISRGNKGTTFVLQKNTEPRQRLLSAIYTGSKVTEAIDELLSLNQNLGKESLELLEGKWNLIWSSQVWLSQGGHVLSQRDWLCILYLLNDGMWGQMSLRHGRASNLSALGETETDSWLDNAANGLMGSQIVKKNGQLKLLVDILLGFKFSMDGTFTKSDGKNYEVIMDDAAIIFGQFGLPMGMERKFTLELLYSDDKIRITRGYKKILFVHVLVD